jgi:dihydrofolate reductase
MRKLFSFIVMTLDGYHEGPNQEFDWPNVDEEFDEFSVSQLNDIGMLVFGRATYEGMAAFWPTELAAAESPEITEFMNSIPKVVISNSLTTAEWNNTTLIKGDVSEVVGALKDQPGKDIAVFGSSTLTASLLDQDLLDELRVMVHPVLLGAGHSLLAGLTSRVNPRAAADHDVPLRQRAAVLPAGQQVTTDRARTGREVAGLPSRCRQDR